VIANKVPPGACQMFRMTIAAGALSAISFRESLEVAGTWSSEGAGNTTERHPARRSCERNGSGWHSAARICVATVKALDASRDNHRR
jgi:hypothetical protein